MKTTTTTARLASFFVALVLTAGTFGGINGLAVHDASDTLVARVQAQHKA